MNRKFQSGAISCLLTLLTCGVAHAFEGEQHINLETCSSINSGVLGQIRWRGPVGAAPPILPTTIQLQNSGGSVDWGTTSFDAGCVKTSAPAASPVTGKCLPGNGGLPATGQVTLTAQEGTSAIAEVPITGSITFATPGISSFSLDVKKTGNANSCTRTFQMEVVANGMGWGDPHLTTVDGVEYDFQSAGEFTLLREPGMEIQARQHAVSSPSGGLHNEYTGLTTCVAVYSAVAARFGSSKVSLQPPSGKDPASPMELWVNGEVVALTPAGIELTVEGKSNGRIVQAGGNIEMTDARGTRLVVTPAYWPDQKIWYLGINVFDTTAREGVLGLIAPESWLPALPDGSSVGSRGEGDGELYEQLYEKFADAWRVGGDGFFTYPNGKGTADFTIDEWPRNNPETCSLEGQTPVQPTDQATAEAACAAIADPVHKKDCIFDVQATGFTGFAESYAAMKDLKPAPAGWAVVGGSEPQPPACDWKCLLKKWWWLILLILLLIIVWRLLRKKSGP